ncbi:MAG: metal ABC transporter permease, partial [Acidimicrobiales bacterium]
LSTALLVGPAAAAMRLTKSPWATLLLATLLGAAATLVGIVLAYDSYGWPPAGHGWPVSFFVVTLVFTFYLLAGVPELRRARGDRLPADRRVGERGIARGAGKRGES